MPLDMLITGRIATLEGDAGFGWVEAIGIRDGRVAFAGSEVFLETRADPFTERIRLEPDQVAIPGLTDAHLHLAQAALASRLVDLGDAATLDDGLAQLKAAHERLPPDDWLEGFGWDSDRWGGWPTADALESVAPGRRAAIWAHDHHALWASHAAIQEADFPDGDPPGGVIRRADDGSPEGMLYEAATRLVSVHLPVPSDDVLDAALIDVGRDLVSLGVVACHDPDGIAPDPTLSFSFPSYARLSDAGRLPLRVHACMRDDAVAAAIEAGHRSGARLGENPAGRATVGWQKCFADGSLGSRTAALLEDIEPEADRPLPPDLRRGVWMTDADRAARAGRAGIGGWDRHDDPRDRRRGDPCHARRADAGRRHVAADAAHRARADAPPGRPAAVRGGRHRRQRPARPSGIGRAAGLEAVGRPGRGRGLHLEVDRRDGRRHAVRDRRPGRVRTIPGLASPLPCAATTRAGRPARRRTPPSRR